MRPGDEAAFDWVVVHVVDLLAAFLGRVDIEVVVAGLPEGTLGGLDRDGEFESLKGFGEDRFPGFAYEQMDVFGHDDVAGDDEVVAETQWSRGIVRIGYGLLGRRGMEAGDNN